VINFLIRKTENKQQNISSEMSILPNNGVTLENVAVAVGVNVGAPDAVSVGVGEIVLVIEKVRVGVFVTIGVFVRVGVFVKVGVFVGILGVRVGEGVPVNVGEYHVPVGVGVGVEQRTESL
jgi:hypothetical protein